MRLQQANSVFVSSSFFIFITRFFPSLANLLVVIWYSRHLPPADYGNYQKFWIQLNVLSPFLCIGLHSLVQTYSRNTLANILSALRLKHYILFSVWVLLVACVFGWLQYDSGNVRFLTSALFIMAFSASVITEALLVVLRRFTVLWVSGLTYAALFLGIHLWALSGNFSIQLIFSCLLVVTMLRVFVHSCAILYEIRKDKDGYEAEDVDFPSVRSLWLHLGLFDAVQVASTWVDKFVMALILSAELSAVYTNGALNIPLIPQLLSAVASAMLLQMAGGQHGRAGHTLALLHRSGRWLSSIVFPVFCFLFFFREELFVTLLSDKYIQSIGIFAMSVLVLPVRAFSFTTILQQQHKGHIINAGAVGELLLACMLMYPLYQWLGLPGVALSFVVSTYIQAAFYLAYSARLLNTTFDALIPWGNWLIKITALSLIMALVHYLATVYFTGNFTLFLGAGMMVASIAACLVAELILEKKHGRIASQIPVEEY